MEREAAFVAGRNAGLATKKNEVGQGWLGEQNFGHLGVGGQPEPARTDFDRCDARVFKMDDERVGLNGIFRPEKRRGGDPALRRGQGKIRRQPGVVRRAELERDLATHPKRESPAIEGPDG